MRFLGRNWMCFEVKGGMNADLYLWAMTSKLWCKLLYRTFKKQCWGEVTTGEKLILLSKSFLERSFLENIHQWSWSSVIRPNENICLVGTCRVRWLSLEHSRWIRSTDQTTSFPSFPFQFFGCASRHVGSSFPIQGSNSHASHWKLGVPTTRPQGSPTISIFF